MIKQSQPKSNYSNFYKRLMTLRQKGKSNAPNQIRKNKALNSIISEQHVEARLHGECDSKVF